VDSDPLKVSCSCHSPKLVGQSYVTGQKMCLVRHFGQSGELGKLVSMGVHGMAARRGETAAPIINGELADMAAKASSHCKMYVSCNLLT
jgi:hypothetical protein